MNNEEERDNSSENNDIEKSRYDIIFELIKSGLEENKENKENRDNSGIIFSLGTILEKILDSDNYVFNGFINAIC